MQGLAVTGRNTSTNNIMTMTNSMQEDFFTLILMSKNVAHFHTLLKEAQGPTIATDDPVAWCVCLQRVCALLKG